MAQLDIAERRLPQDGRFSFIASGFPEPIDCRISTFVLRYKVKDCYKTLR